MEILIAVICMGRERERERGFHFKRSGLHFSDHLSVFGVWTRKWVRFLRCSLLLYGCMRKQWGSAEVKGAHTHIYKHIIMKRHIYRHLFNMYAHTHTRYFCCIKTYSHTQTHEYLFKKCKNFCIFVTRTFHHHM